MSQEYNYDTLLSFGKRHILRWTGSYKDGTKVVNLGTNVSTIADLDGNLSDYLGNKERCRYMWNKPHTKGHITVQISDDSYEFDYEFRDYMHYLKLDDSKVNGCNLYDILVQAMKSRNHEGDFTIMFHPMVTSVDMWPFEVSSINTTVVPAPVPVPEPNDSGDMVIEGLTDIFEDYDDD